MKTPKNLMSLSIALENVTDFVEHDKKFLSSWGMTERQFQESIIDGLNLDCFNMDQIARISVLGKLRGFDLIKARLFAIIEDNSYTFNQRCTAIAAVWFYPETQEMYDNLETSLKIKLSKPWLYPMIKTCKNEMFTRFALNHLITATPDENLVELLEIIEEIRLYCDVPATCVYSHFINNCTESRAELAMLVSKLNPYELGYDVKNKVGPLFNMVNNNTFSTESLTIQ